MTRKSPPDWLLAFVLLAGVYLWQRTAVPAWMIDLFHIQYAAHEWRHGDAEHADRLVAEPSKGEPQHARG